METSMSVLSRELTAEKLPLRTDSSLESAGRPELLTQDLKNMSDDEITQKIENILLERVNAGDEQAIFQIAQLYFEQEDYGKAREYFGRASELGDLQSRYQLAVIEYDLMAEGCDQKRGFELMMEVATNTTKKGKHLVRAAQFNIGRAYFQGYGCKQSYTVAERFFITAADDGHPRGSVKAQTTLGFYYTEDNRLDKRKAFFWHSEACGNGSLESQGALGVMHLHGIGTKVDWDKAFVCLREAAERGNVYAMGNLVEYYYKRKLMTKAVELAARVSLFEDVNQIAYETECLPSFVAKGIAMACFYYARCLQLGLGVKKNVDECKTYYSRSYYFSGDVCANLQRSVIMGEI